MKDAAPKTIFLKDYQKPNYTISQVDLVFDLHDTQTRVSSTLQISRVEKENKTPLVLNGEELKLIDLRVDGRELSENEYHLGEDCLQISQVPESFTLEIEVEINPTANKALDGLYKSGDIFCTQNEPEGFRRITYFIDRPDIMAKYTTKIIADKTQYPVLLSNGNPTEKGELDDGRHWVCWEDPFPKPSYLYALVAGDLGFIQDSYTTQSGRVIDCRIYCDKGNESKCHHAMESLKKSMRWDEETFGLEYDLDIYMIVAVDSFNMGAMENKGLNIFNSVFVLANEKTATDSNFLGIESVVGHEYFHNWTGNRVTCRDWFQLTLKEGLTVFRDQEFSSDLNSRTVQRIQDVAGLRSVQFMEDAGPTAHPIKPSQYMEINNFYTATVYEKGAEVIRMVRTFLGKEGFRKGIDRYFELFDGQAVTTEDFLKAMSEANDNYDLSQFERWYHQAGTPEVNIKYSYDGASKTFQLDIEQRCPATPDLEDKLPFHFPLGIGLLDQKGEEIELDLKETKSLQTDLDRGFLHIRNQRETFVFDNVEQEPVLSVNRGFAAPIKIEAPYRVKELAFILANDSDEFNRYEAAQTLASRVIAAGLEEVEKGKKVEELSLDPVYVEAYGKLLEDQSLDPALKAMILSIPGEGILHQSHDPIDFQAIHEVREAVITSLAKSYRELLTGIYEANRLGEKYALDPVSIGKRSLRNCCLSYLTKIGDASVIDLGKRHFYEASNMTDEMAALSILQQIDCPERVEVSKAFFEKWRHETLVMQKWLSAEASSSVPGVFERIMELESSEVYDKTVPNLVRSIWGAFARNFIYFHHESGQGYKLMADKIVELDKLNPQIASRLASSFRLFKKLQPAQRERMQEELMQIKEIPHLSKNVYEIIFKTLDQQ